jgi:hypothetical protein
MMMEGEPLRAGTRVGKRGFEAFDRLEFLHRGFQNTRREKQTKGEIYTAFTSIVLWGSGAAIGLINQGVSGEGRKRTRDTTGALFDGYVSSSYHRRQRSNHSPNRTSHPQRAPAFPAYLVSFPQRILVLVRITDDDIRRFQEIWREEFEEDISVDGAREHIGRLDALYLMLARPPVKGQEAAPSGTEDTQNL